MDMDRILARIVGRIRLLRIDSQKRLLITRVKNENMTYLEYAALVDLCRSIEKIESKQLEGIFIEAGCALGGSTIVIGAWKDKSRLLRVYDAFGMIPSPSSEDGQDAWNRYAVIKSGRAKGLGDGVYYGYKENLLDEVRNNLNRFGVHENIELIKGFYQDTLHIDQPVAFAHIDCDWYDSVWTCLKEVVPQLVPQGEMIIDDYFRWSGCRSAVDHFFEGIRGRFIFERKCCLHITKK